MVISAYTYCQHCHAILKTNTNCICQIQNEEDLPTNIIVSYLDEMINSLREERTFNYAKCEIK